MIEYKKGDIFKERVDALINPVNCVGTMGKGLALEFKQRYPDNYNAYIAACRKDLMQVGNVFVYEVSRETRPHCIINFPTKAHWKEKSQLIYIKFGLNSLLHVIKQHNICSIAIPALGCGLGGLDWSEVKPVISEFMQEPKVKHVHTIVFEPG